MCLIQKSFVKTLRTELKLKGKTKNMKNKSDVDFKWNVWIWNFNHDKLEQYDVVPMLLRELKSLRKDDFPMDKKSMNKELKEWARYHFWAKCEYEMIVHGWPEQKNDEKVDVYNQLMLNWDTFSEAFWKNVWKPIVDKKKKSKKPKK